MDAETFFTEQEKERIAAAIEAVEKKTAGEVAVMVVNQSDGYPGVALLTGIVFGGMIALVVTDLLLRQSLWSFVPLTALFAVLLSWLTNQLPGLKRFLLPPALIEEKVRESALRAFYEQGLDKTRDNTGVLFFISLMEHKVWVLADKGIYAKLTPEELQSYAGQVAKGIKSGNSAAALCQAIQSVGQVLAAHFPVRQDDTDELSNAVRIG